MVNRDQIIRSLWRKGRACAADIAGDLVPATSATELLEVMNRLVQEGLVRRVEIDLAKDPREYKEPYQAVYELANV